MSEAQEVPIANFTSPLSPQAVQVVVQGHHVMTALEMKELLRKVVIFWAAPFVGKTQKQDNLAVL